MTDTRTQEFLDETADYIEERGWGQGDEVLSGSKTCIALAMQRVAGGNLTLYDELKGVVRERIQINRYTPLSAWNDAPERTKAEVLAVLRGR